MCPALTFSNESRASNITKHSVFSLWDIVHPSSPRNSLTSGVTDLNLQLAIVIEKICYYQQQKATCPQCPGCSIEPCDCANRPEWQRNRLIIAHSTCHLTQNSPRIDAQASSGCQLLISCFKVKGSATKQPSSTTLPKQGPQPSSAATSTSDEACTRTR